MTRNYRESIANLLLKERKVKIISEVPARIKCALCGHVIVDARQSPCGCRFCFECIADYLKKGASFCPGESVECSDEELVLGTNVINDFGTDQEIRRLNFRCHNDDCTFEGQFRLMDEHLEKCPFGTECCELCGESFRRLNMNEHKMKVCPNRFINCEFCGTDILAHLMISEHINIKSENICPKFQCVCPLKCDIIEPVILEKHRRVCANRPRKCPYSIVGCPANGFTKKDLNNHITQHIFDHSRILFETLEQYKEEVSVLQNKVQNIEDNFLSFVWKIDSFLSNNSRTSIISPKFSFGTYGYQARMKIIVNDDNVQLYFILVQGEYDDILQWPFDRNVKISILDQNQQNKHYSKTLKNSLDLECFQKPMEKNKGCGWDQFINLNVLKNSDNLLRNDCLFIKCTMNA